MAIEYEAAFKLGDGYLRLIMDSANLAATKIEESGVSGTVTRVLVEANQPGRWPERVHTTLAHWVYDDGCWYAVDLDTGERTDTQRPGSLP
jgi:hypothetical protein